MLKIDGNKTIHITRGDFGTIIVNINQAISGWMRLTVYEANHLENVIFSAQSNESTESDTSRAITIFPTDTKNNVPASNTPITYWYEIELNPLDVDPITLVGYDTLGPKLFVVYPEGLIDEGE